MGDEADTEGAPTPAREAAGTAAEARRRGRRTTGGPEPGSAAAVAVAVAVAEPPDGGWAWLVLLGTFLVLVSILGYLVGLSVFFVPWRDEFQASAAAVSVVMSMGSFVRGVSSPVVGLLFSKFSGRAVLMAGGLISSVGILLTSFSTTVPYLVCTSGIIAGFGHSCCFNAAHAMLRCYFKKHYSLAVGLTHAGVSAGQLAYPPLYTWLLGGYGWRGSLVIMSAVNMNLLVVGALMRPVRARPKTPKAGGGDVRGVTAGVLESPEALSGEDQSSTIKVERRMAGRHAERPEDDCDDAREGAVDDGSDHDGETEVGRDLAARVSGEDVASSRAAGESGRVRGDEDGAVGEAARPCPCPGRAAPCLRRAGRFLLDTYGLRRLAGNLSFLLVCCVAFLTAYGFACVGVHLVARTEFVGLGRESASWLLSVVGGAGLVVRPVTGLCLDRGSVSSEATYSVAMLGMAAACSLVPQFTAFAPLALVAAAIGAAGGVCGSVIMVIMFNAVRLSEAAAATGITMLSWSLGEVAGGFFAGFLFDATGVYEYSFYSAGATSMVGGFLSLVIHFRMKRRKRSSGTTHADAYCADNPGFSMTETAVDLTPSNEPQHKVPVTERTRENENSEATEAASHGCSMEDSSTENVSCGGDASSTDRDADGLVDEGAMKKDADGLVDEGAVKKDVAQAPMGEVH